MKKLLLIVGVVLAFLALAGWGGLEVYRASNAAAPASIPTTRVKRGDVTFAISARGELQGGNSEMLTAPMTGGGELVITDLRKAGDVVETGDVVAQFDTTEQAFNLREAEADLAETEQQVVQAKAESEAREEEARYLIMQAQAELRIAELEVRRNELVASIIARQNTLALDAARDRLYKLTQDITNRKATTEAGVAIQEAARNRAKVKAETADRNIKSMTLRAKRSGYVALQQNTNGNFMFGMHLPVFQIGDQVRPGMGVAQIPDLDNWEVSARISELDRGHLAVGQKAEIAVVALPGKTISGKVKAIGGTTGPPWDRYSDVRISLDQSRSGLRPGMSARIVITTAVMPNVLWVPSQALFEADGRVFVHAQSGGAFTPVDVKLVQRSESQVVLTGLKEGQVVALASPDLRHDRKDSPTGAMQALPKS